MKSFNALSSFVALALVFLSTKAVASPLPRESSVEESVSELPRGLLLPDNAEDALTEVESLLRREAQPYGRGWRGHRWNHKRDLEDSSAPDDSVLLKREVEHDDRHFGGVDAENPDRRAVGYYWDPHPQHWYGRDVSDSRDVGYYWDHHRPKHWYGRDVADAESTHAAGYYWDHHPYRHYGRDDAEVESTGKAGYYWDHRPYHRYIRDGIAREDTLALSDKIRREVGYYDPHRHWHFLRDSDTAGGQPEAAKPSEDDTLLKRDGAEKADYYTPGEQPEEAANLSEDDTLLKRDSIEGADAHPEIVQPGGAKKLSEDDTLLKRDDAKETDDQWHRWNRDHNGYPRSTQHHWWRHHHHKYVGREDMEEMTRDTGVQSVAGREVERHHHHHRYPRVAADGDREGKTKKESKAEEVKEGVAHGAGTAAKETVGGFLGRV